MRLIDEKLYIEFLEMVSSGVSEGYLRKAKSTGTKCWSFLKDPEDGRKVLIEFEGLKDKYKDLVDEKFGNPYEYVVREPIKAMVVYDEKAEEFYLSYEYDGKKLSEEHVQRFAVAASWLNMIRDSMKDKKELKRMLNLTIDQFYTHVIELIKIEKVALPTSYRNLVGGKDSALKKYLNNGYQSLISAKFGNNNSAKIADAVSEAVLLRLIEHPNQYDDVFIAMQYNEWAKSENARLGEEKYKAIKSATVGLHRRNKESEIIIGREGQAAFNDKFLKKVMRKRPSHPLLLVEHDDNHLDLLFTSVDGGRYDYNKYKAIVVIDSFNDYVLGYAYTDGQITTELIKAAYSNAMYHLRTLTGEWHLPHELKSDRWALEALRPFYKTIGKYFDTPVGSKGRGYLEQFFGSPHWKRCMKAGANNYTGNNLTARNAGVNREALEKAKKDRPLIGDEACKQIEAFFWRLRHAPTGEGKPSKQAVWLEAWNSLPLDKRRVITDEQFLFKFGIEHNYRGKGISISNKGIQPQINGAKYDYTLDQYRIEDIGKSVSVKYDPYDMSRVLLRDGEGLRVMAHNTHYTPSALGDHHDGSRAFLNAIFEEKKEQQLSAHTATNKRTETLKKHLIDAEALLQSGYMVKELKQEAEQAYISRNAGSKEEYNIYDNI